MESLFDVWHPSWKELPWKVWTSPVERFQVLPSFVIGEFFFIFTSLLLLVHALKHGRVYVMLWFSSLLTGTANDAFFMALPLVDNFWQSQACIMLTPRMPLYIPMVYVVFMYPSLVGAWRFKMPALAQAALAGLMGEMVYSPYDITGAKFLWWTWHDTDAPIRDRLFGAPIGSSTWVITFSCSFQLIWRYLLTQDQVKFGSGLSIGGALWKITFSALTTTPLMMVQMALFQLISGDAQGLPTIRTMLACIITYLILIYFFTHDEDDKKNLLHTVKHGDVLIRFWMTLYYVYLFCNMLIATPEDHMSTGVHQIVGNCDIYDKDMAGHKRQVYLCQTNYEEDFNFDCPNFDAHPDSRKLLPDGTEWYTVCANPHSNKLHYSLAILGLASMGIFMYRTAFYEKATIKSKKLK